MSEQVMIQVRMDGELKDKAMEVFEEIGIDMSTAVRMFFKAAVREQRLPISTCISKPATAGGINQLSRHVAERMFYESDIAEDEKTVVVLPLENGEIPISMFIQVLTKVPSGMVTRWEDIYEYIGELYEREVHSRPVRMMPIMDSESNSLPYWRIISERGTLIESRLCSREYQRMKLEEEGVKVVQRGNNNNSFRVDNYKSYLFDFEKLEIIRR